MYVNIHMGYNIEKCKVYVYDVVGVYRYVDEEGETNLEGLIIRLVCLLRVQVITRHLLM